MQNLSPGAVQLADQRPGGELQVEILTQQPCGLAVLGTPADKRPAPEFAAEEQRFTYGKTGGQQAFLVNEMHAQRLNLPRAQRRKRLPVHCQGATVGPMDTCQHFDQG